MHASGGTSNPDPVLFRAIFYLTGLQNRIVPMLGIEPRTFRSSGWRSPNWPIKAVTNFRPRKIKRVSKTVLCESSSSCCALVGRPWLYKGHLSNRPDNCQVIPRKSFERELRSLSPEFTFLYRPPPPPPPPSRAWVAAKTTPICKPWLPTELSYPGGVSS